jgi:hypothetical protein
LPFNAFITISWAMVFTFHKVQPLGDAAADGSEPVLWR